MQIIRCKEKNCTKEAVFYSPKDMCSFHWTTWWMQGYKKYMSPKEYHLEFNRLLQINALK